MSEEERATVRRILGSEDYDGDRALSEEIRRDRVLRHPEWHAPQGRTSNHWPTKPTTKRKATVLTSTDRAALLRDIIEDPDALKGMSESERKVVGQLGQLPGIVTNLVAGTLPPDARRTARLAIRYNAQVQLDALDAPATDAAGEPIAPGPNVLDTVALVRAARARPQFLLTFTAEQFARVREVVPGSDLDEYVRLASDETVSPRVVGRARLLAASALDKARLAHEVDGLNTGRRVVGVSGGGEADTGSPRVLLSGGVEVDAEMSENGRAALSREHANRGGHC